MRSVDIVIVNWNAGDQLAAALASVDGVRDRDRVARVVVVDNASSDGSATALPTALDDGRIPVEVVLNERNVGFAAACNQGAALGHGAYVLLLNPDAELRDGALDACVSFLEGPSNGDVGIVGVQLIDERGHVARTCARFPTPRSILGGVTGASRVLPRVFPPHFMTDWDHAETRQVDQVIGAFFFVRRTLWEQLAGLDERFFVYYEELDFARRARTAGAQTWYLATAQAFHRGEGTSGQARAARLFYNLRSRILYGHKHFALPVALLLATLTLTVEPITRISLYAGRRDWRSVSETWAGFRRLWGQAGSLMAGRARTDG